MGPLIACHQDNIPQHVVPIRRVSVSIVGHLILNIYLVRSYGIKLYTVGLTHGCKHIKVDKFLILALVQVQLI